MNRSRRKSEKPFVSKVPRRIRFVSLVVCFVFVMFACRVFVSGDVAASNDYIIRFKED